VTASVDDVLRAMQGLAVDKSWAQVAPSIVPLLPRHTPSPVRAGAPIQAYLPPGIPVSFGIDLGPAFAAVTRELADGWGVDSATVAKTALDNIRALAAGLPAAAVQQVALDSRTSVRILQSHAGWASAVLLLPDLLPRFFGPGPHIVGAPCRDVVMAFPPSMPIDLVADIVEAISYDDPAGIAVGGFRHHAGSLEAVPFARLQAVFDARHAGHPFGPVVS
jgi:hypothetical protein